MSAANIDQVLDVAIVGGGVSGLYSGWRLLSDTSGATARDGRLQVTVFEGSQRVGGRLLSVTPPHMNDTRCELGGMRYMTHHVLVANLVHQFGLHTEPMAVDSPSNIAYVRGRRLRLAQLQSPDALPYNFTDTERFVLSQPNGDLLSFALEQILPGCLTMPHDVLLQALPQACFDGRPLREQGFWNVLARILSPDGYAFVRNTGGYDCLVSNWNAADALAFILADFGSSAAYFRFPNGFAELTEQLARVFTQAGGQLQCGKWLRSFDTTTLPDGHTGVELRFSDRSTVLARRLVLAMPRRSLELLAPEGAVLGPGHPEVRKLIESVEPVPLFKLFLCYDRPWWSSLDVSQGRSVTDQPIRQCYYWAEEQDASGAPGRSCLLASYDDDASVGFWAGLRAKHLPTLQWKAPADAPASNRADDWSHYQAPAAMVEEAHRQLLAMHGLSYAPKPYAAVYKDWMDDPFGGGVHFWRIHAHSTEVIPAMVNPRPGVPVYVCGEAYSREQGWVEGALQTAEIMLQRHFGLQPPPTPQPHAAQADATPAQARSRRS